MFLSTVKEIWAPVNSGALFYLVKTPQLQRKLWKNPGGDLAVLRLLAFLA